MACPTSPQATKKGNGTLGSGQDGDPCLGCGSHGSACYNQCVADALIGIVDACNAGNQLGGTGTGGTNLLKQIQDAILAPVEAWLPSALEKVGLFLFALILVIIGFVILR